MVSTFSLVCLVPVLGRPQNVEPLVRSWLAGGAPGRLVFVVEIADVDERLAVERAASLHAVEFVRVVDAHTWPEKICAGVEAYPEAEWYLFAADDVTFQPGWWTATKQLRADPTVGVIGTNDMANPRTMSGEHTTHPLVRGTYAREQGTIDNPRMPVHTGYQHWFVDDELVWTAKHRGAWAHCPDAVIAHHHPYFDLSVPWDGTYGRGEQSAGQDRAVFASRCHMFGVEIG